MKKKLLLLAFAVGILLASCIPTLANPTATPTATPPKYTPPVLLTIIQSAKEVTQEGTFFTETEILTVGGREMISARFRYEEVTPGDLWVKATVYGVQIAWALNKPPYSFGWRPSAMYDFRIPFEFLRIERDSPRIVWELFRNDILIYKEVISF